MNINKQYNMYFILISLSKEGRVKEVQSCTSSQKREGPTGRSGLTMGQRSKQNCLGMGSYSTQPVFASHELL